MKSALVTLTVLGVIWFIAPISIAYVHETYIRQPVELPKVEPIPMESIYDSCMSWVEDTGASDQEFCVWVANQDGADSQ